MIGEITYGGRVTEELDFRVLKSTLNLFMSYDSANSDAFRFSESGIYYIPHVKDRENFPMWIEYINTLPDQDPPEIFGMHSNADITFQRNSSQR